MALGIGPKAGLLTTPITFLATANAAKMCNASVYFADVDHISGLLTADTIEKSLKKYQITIKQIVSAKYVEEFFNDNTDLVKKSKKITEGCNPNEVRFYKNIKKNEGFFVKFFNFFK